MAGPEKREIASIARDPLVASWTGTLEPSDETIRLRGGGKGVALYDEIRRDPHAYAVLQKRKLEVCSREWAVFPASEKRIDKKAAEIVERQLKKINFDGLTRGLMGAVAKGFAVGEVMWANIDGEWTVTQVKVRRQRRFRFTVDGELRLITRDNMIDGEALPGRKFIVHRYSIDDDDDDPYGVGLGSVLYWPAWFKRQALANWLRATERFAAPTVDASYAGNYDKKRQDEILTALRTMANDAGIVHPENVKIALLEAAKGGGGEFLEALNRYLDELMSEAVLGETLTTNSGERGARSLGEVHDGVRVAIAKADADLISHTLRDTLVRWIVELNVPGAQVPDVWRDFAEAEDLDKRVQRDKTLHDMGYEPADVDYVNDTYGGDWVKRETPAPAPGAQPGEAGPTAGQERSAAAAAAFADPPDEGAAVVDELAGQLGTLAAPAIEAMVGAVRRAVDTAVSWDDLSDKLLALSSQIETEDLAQLLEQAMIVAELSGRDGAAGEIGDGR